MNIRIMKLAKLVLLGFLSAVGMSGCSDDGDKVKTVTKLEPIPFTKAELKAHEAAAPFGINIFKKYAELSDEQNVMLSPLSAMLDLGMLANGATDETLEEILGSLGLDASSLEDFNAYASRLMSNIKDVDKSTEIELANAVFYMRDSSIIPAYLDKMKNYYSADAFAVEEGAAQQTINSWLSNYVPGLKLDSNEDSGGQICSLLNALRFKGVWKDQFLKSNTAKYDFTGFDNAVTKVDYLCDKRVVHISQNEYFICANLKFGNGAYSISFLKPNEEKGIDHCLNQLDYEMWNMLQSSGELYDLNLRIPKFEVEHEADLIPSMNSLGIKRLFSYGDAQLDNLFEVSRELYVGRLHQGSGFSIDEEGAVVESYTQADILVTSSEPDKIKDGSDLFFDHPFLFAITEYRSGALLFMGKIGKL